MKAVKFHVSDKVVCVREFPYTAAAASGVGLVYCVSGIDVYENPNWAFRASEGIQHIFLTGITGVQRPVAGGEFSFPADHFRLL